MMMMMMMMMMFVSLQLFVTLVEPLHATVMRIRLRAVLLVLLGACCMLVVDHALLVYRARQGQGTDQTLDKAINTRVANLNLSNVKSTSSYLDKSKNVHSVQLNAQLLNMNPEKCRIIQWTGERWVSLPHYCDGDYQFEKATLKTSFGSTPIFIHNITDDRHVSGHLKRYGMWDSQNVNAVVDEMKKDPSIQFLDLGAQLGTHTLVVSLLGRNVVAVDPLQANVLRLCKSLRAGRFKNNVTVVFNALSDDHRKISFILDKGNLGGTRITSRGATLNESIANRGDSLYTVLLDELLPFVNFKKAFMKIDVETHELEVIKGGMKFFREVNITGILMEWMFHRKDGQELKVLMHNLGFRPFDSHRKSRLNETRHDNWPDDVLWLK